MVYILSKILLKISYKYFPSNHPQFLFQKYYPDISPVIPLKFFQKCCPDISRVIPFKFFPEILSKYSTDISSSIFPLEKYLQNHFSSPYKYFLHNFPYAHTYTYASSVIR
jgi:hypothetical protein